MKREIKIGERVFYECEDGQIESGIVTGIEDSTYTNENGKEIPFQMLHIGKYGIIEDYNILSKKKTREFKSKYKVVDKTIKKIKDMLESYDENLKKYIIESLSNL